MRGDRVKTQSLPQHAKAKQKEPWTSPLCGGGQGWCRYRYANGEAASLILLRQLAADLASQGPRSNVIGNPDAQSLAAKLLVWSLPFSRPNAGSDAQQLERFAVTYNRQSNPDAASEVSGTWQPSALEGAPSSLPIARHFLACFDAKWRLGQSLVPATGTLDQVRSMSLSVVLLLILMLTESIGRCCRYSGPDCSPPLRHVIAIHT